MPVTNDGPSMKWLFESHLPQRIESHPELAAAAGSSFRFVVQGEEAGTWLVDLRAGQAGVVPEGSGGLCTVVTSAVTLAGIAGGRVNPRTAWEDGRLKAEGEFQPAMIPPLMHLLQIPGDGKAAGPAGEGRADSTALPPRGPQTVAGIRPPAAGPGELVVASVRERPDLLPIANAIVACAWPEFMLHNPVANRYWKEMYAAFPDLQFVMHDATTEEVVAVGASAALAWDPEVEGWPEGGWDWALARAVEDHRAGLTPTAQCGLVIAIAPDHQGRGLSTKMVKAMKALGQRRRLGVLAIPVRPSLKSRYPLIPIERYVTWRQGDGRPFDSWLRSHTSVGAEIIGPCLRSTLIEGSVSEWEEWAKMRFPESGSYVVPGALVPVEIDRPADRGVYLEPNVWVRHPMER
jgi:GNAT superfamily N-acetyltransferase